MLRVELKSKDSLSLNKKEQAYFESKILEIEYLFKNMDVQANVLVSSKGTDFKTEITIPTKHIILRAESKGHTLYESVDATVEKIEKQFLRHRKRINTLIRKREGIKQYFLEEEHDEEVNHVVSKSKEVPSEVMDVEEAITRLEMLDHDFFLFINEADHKPTLLYLRQDGTYGTIEMK